MADEVVQVSAEQTTPVVTETPIVETPKVDTVLNAETPKNWYTDEWRNKLSGGDEAEAKRLARFTDPNQIYKSYRELEAKVSSGAFKQPLSDKATPEQLAEYRKANGIPETAGDYQITLPENLVLGEEDKAVLGGVLETMHKQNRTPAEVNAVVGAFYEAREALMGEEIERQKYERTQAEEELRQHWQGNAYLSNLGAVKNLLSAMPDGVGELLQNAKLADGSLAGNNPAVLRALANIALELNPAGTVVPGGGTDQMKSVESELSELDALMKKDINAWRKNSPGRERHRELIDAKLNLQRRGYA